MNIPDEAVEAAAKATYDDVRVRMAFPSGFHEAPGPLRLTYIAMARAALTAAAPYLMAVAWEEGFDRGREPDAYTEDANPYRSAGAGK